MAQLMCFFEVIKSMADLKEASIDDILKSIREAIVEKERRQYFKSLLVKREDVPYQLGVWSFDDVAQKMMKKYRSYFNRQPQPVVVSGVRVRAKKDA